MKRPLILASQSPRRAELLKRLVSDFEILPSRSAERAQSDDPHELVRLLAEEKAEDVFARRPDALVIGADTVVFLDGKRFGKPRDRADAERMLRALSGREHSVLTGVSLLSAEGRECFDCESFVTFRRLDEAFLAAYLDTGIPFDKAGGYGIQCEPSPVESWRGDYENIVGLPISALRKRLQTKEE